MEKRVTHNLCDSIKFNKFSILNQIYTSSDMRYPITYLGCIKYTSLEMRYHIKYLDCIKYTSLEMRYHIKYLGCIKHTSLEMRYTITYLGYIKHTSLDEISHQIVRLYEVHLPSDI